MTVNNADFKVKKGLVVADGDVTLASDHSVKAGTFDTNVAAAGVTLTGVTLSADGTDTNIPINITPKGTGSVVMSKVDINGGTGDFDTVNIDGGAIDGTIIGGTSQAAGYFTTLDATNTIEARATGSAIRTAGKLCVNEPDVDSSTIPTRTQAAVYGKTVAGSGTMSDGSTTAGTTVKDYVELLLQTDAPESDIDGYVANYVGNAVVLDNVENVPTTGQGVIFSVGGSGSGDSWGVGRAGSTGGGVFQIGYFAESWQKSHTKTTNSMMRSQSLLDIDTSGNATLNANGAYFAFTGATSGAASREIRFKASSNAISTDNTGSQTYTLPTDFPDGNGYVLSSQTNGTLSWIAAAGGADGMGSGFTVSATTDSNATTITQGDDLFFAASGGLTAETTADGTVTHGLDIDGLTAVDIASGDFLAFADISNAGNATRKDTVADLATLFAGTGLTASSAVIGVDAAQTQITSVGALTGLSTAAAASVDINGADVDITATTLSIDSTDTTNLTMTANSSSAKALTIDAANSGSGAASISIGTTSGTAISIGHTTSETTINDNLTVTGDLTVNGTTTTVNSTTIQLDDKNIELANGVGNDAAIDGGGITLISSGTNKTFNYVNANTAWTSSENFDIVSGKKYKLGGADIFTNATTLASGVVTSSLTTVSDLDAGSITSNFGSINNGASAITTTGTITGGVLVADNLQLDGNVLSSTNSNGDITLTPNGTGEVNIAAGNLNYAGTAVTATGAELNVLDGVTAGTVSASLALVVDSNKDLGTIRNLTSNGTVQGSKLSVDAIAVIDSSTATSQSWTGGTAYNIATYAYGSYRTAKFVVQISDGTDIDVAEVLVTWKGSSNPSSNSAIYLTTYAYMSTAASDLGTIDADLDASGEVIELRFTPSTTGTYAYDVVNTLLVK